MACAVSPGVLPATAGCTSGTLPHPPDRFGAVSVVEAFVVVDNADVARPAVVDAAEPDDDPPDEHAATTVSAISASASALARRRARRGRWGGGTAGQCTDGP